MLPRLLTAICEVPNEAAYYAGFDLMNQVKASLARALADEILKSQDIIMEGNDIPTRQLRTFSVGVYPMTRKAIIELVEQSVNRYAAGMPPINF